MEKKLTKRDVINQMLGEGVIQENEIYKNYLEHELELLDRKNSSKGLSKTQVENEKVAKVLVEELGKIARPVTISDLMEESAIVKEYRLENGTALTNQKISAIFKKLVDNGSIVKTSEKKKSYFSLAN